MRPVRTCSRCPAETNGTLLCLAHQREALRSIRRDARDKEELLREEDPDA